MCNLYASSSICDVPLLSEMKVLAAGGCSRGLQLDVWMAHSVSSSLTLQLILILCLTQFPLEVYFVTV
jgi:hypothetical protein